MPSSRFEPSSIKNKIKREEIARKLRKSKGQSKLQRRLALAKEEATNPAAKKVCPTIVIHVTETYVIIREDKLKMHHEHWTTLVNLTHLF